MNSLTWVPPLLNVGTGMPLRLTLLLLSTKAISLTSFCIISSSMSSLMMLGPALFSRLSYWIHRGMPLNFRANLSELGSQQCQWL